MFILVGTPQLVAMSHESAIAYLVSLPTLLIDAVATALGAVFGAIVCKPIKSRKLRGLVALACAIAALFTAEPLVNVLRDKYAYVTEVNNYKSTRLLALSLNTIPKRNSN